MINKPDVVIQIKFSLGDALTQEESQILLIAPQKSMSKLEQGSQI